jgi:uncharacterized protein
MRRILTIDGGGIKGMFPASFLAAIEDSIGDSVARYFDLIVGTSTGGIIALGLGLGFPAQEIATLYEELGGKVFAGNRSVLRSFRQLLFAKYSDQPLKEALAAKFGQRRLGESANRLVIPALNLDTGGVHIFKTSHHPRFGRDYKEMVMDVALATSAGPTFFPTHRLLTGTPLVDGGLLANNPIGLAVVEAIGVLEWPRESIKVLSLGCTNTPLKVGWGGRLALGLGYWGGKIVGVFMAAQSSAALGTAAVLIGHENIIRVDISAPKGRFNMDSIHELSSLKGLGDSKAREFLPHIRETFFTIPADQFEPYYKLG